MGRRVQIKMNKSASSKGRPVIHREGVGITDTGGALVFCGIILGVIMLAAVVAMA